MRILLLLLILHSSFFGFSQIISEPFTSGSQPAGWNQSSVTFTTASGGYANFTSGTSTLTSPTFNAATFCSVLVTFDVAKFGTGGDGPITVEYSLDGGTTWIVAGNSPTPTSSTYVSASISIPAVSANMQIRFNRGSSPSQKRFRNVVITGVGSCGSSNTINAGTISGGPFNVNCAGTSASGSINYTSTGTFTAGNTFTVQLSDASGSFASPTTIGTTSSTAGSGTLNFTIPSGTPSGSGYLIRIIASNPSTTSTNSASFTITQVGSCTMIEPYISSIIYDGCDGTCGSGNEGLSEIVFGNTGSYSMLVNSANVDLTYTTGGYNMTTTVVNNTATTSALNTAAGCAGLFVDAFNTTLPPNATFLMVSESLCVNALTWSDLCGQGPIYIIYGGAGAGGDTWHDGGNFGNSGSVKNYTTSFTTTSGTFSMNYSYDPPGSGTDGNYATYAIGSGTPATQGNFPNCTITPVALASELIEYTGELQNNESILYWKTASERNNASFSIHHSTNGIDWQEIGSVLGHGTTNYESNYTLRHKNPNIGLNYYQLSAFDNDGIRSNIGIVAIEVAGNFAFYNASSNQLEFNEPRSVALISMDGKIVSKGIHIEQLATSAKGVFILQDLNSGEKQRVIIY